MLKSRQGQRCSYCQLTLAPDKVQTHLGSKFHYLNLMKHKLSSNDDELTKDKEGIRITCPETNENGTIMTIRCVISQFADISVVIQSDRYDVTLQKALLLQFDSGAEISLLNPVEDASVKISKGSSHTLKLRGLTDQQCCKIVSLVMKFFRQGQPSIFLARYIKLACVDEAVARLEPETPYVATEPVARLPDANRIIPIKIAASRSAKATANNRSGTSKLEFVPGEDEDPDAAFDQPETERPVALARYKAPQFLVKFHLNGLEETPDMDERDKDDLKEILETLQVGISSENPDNYDTFFQTLLHFEDIQQETDIRMYDNPCAELINFEGDVERFELKVEGLEEGRPSVLQYDKIYIREQGGSIEYEGFIDRVKANSIEIIMNDAFIKLYYTKLETDSGDEHEAIEASSLRFGVRFSINRKVMRLMHRAVGLYRYVMYELHMRIDRLLMPCVQWPANPSVDQLDNLQLSNKHILNNREQLCAVRNIVLGLHRPAPYVLFGPPGTGKTTTITEAIIQVYKVIPESRILILTPSNSAANVIAEKILNSKAIPESDIFRMYGVACNPQKASAALKSISNWDESSKKFEEQNKDTLLVYRILTCTLSLSGSLVSMGIRREHFTHFFIDEAGHATEPEALIPLTGLLSVYDGISKVGGSVVLSGDHLQLGPVVRSPIAKSYGMDKSILERIMARELYARQRNGSYNPMILTKLIRNFRSHPKILEVPNRLFYDGELEAHGDKDITHSLIMYEKLPTKGVPIIFHGVFGREMREANNPSFFNPEEISIVIDYIRSLLSPQTKTFDDVPIEQSDIGIIAPYRKQVLKFRFILKEYGLDKISVGSTEEFQGQERLVMFISTVRCSGKALDAKQGTSLGFLANPKRFNVATTRAKALMIIVGDPRVLQKDYRWRSLLSTCEDYNACTGERSLSAAQQYDDLFRKLEELQLCLGLEMLKGVKLSSNGKITITQLSLQEEPKWRDSD